MINPFQIPGLYEDPVRPLRPWETAEHEKYYADVDNTADSYERFIAQMGNADTLLRNGRLIVVAGQNGCGKTSLVNRCVHWLQTEFVKRNEDKNLIVTPVDLTQASDSSRDVPKRMIDVSASLADEVKMEKLVEDRWIQDITTSAGEPAALYRRLSHALNDNMILVVLLPPIELVPLTPGLQEEIKNYHRHADAHLVFFLEVALAEEPERLSSLRAGNGPPLIVLPVRPLRASDGELFTTARFKLHSSEAVFPELEEVARQQITGRKCSVKFLQKLLYNVYEARRKDGKRYTRTDLVTFNEITNFFFLQPDEGDGPGTGYR